MFPFSLNFRKSENGKCSAVVRDGPSQGNTSAVIEGTQKREKREKREGGEKDT
jgi:hypothetical protein